MNLVVKGLMFACLFEIGQLHPFLRLQFRCNWIGKNGNTGCLKKCIHSSNC